MLLIQKSHQCRTSLAGYDPSQAENFTTENSFPIAFLMFESMIEYKNIFTQCIAIREVLQMKAGDLSPGPDWLVYHCCFDPDFAVVGICKR